MLTENEEQPERLAGGALKNSMMEKLFFFHFLFKHALCS